MGHRYAACWALRRKPRSRPLSFQRTPGSPHSSFRRTPGSPHSSFRRTPEPPHSSFRRTPEPSACRAVQRHWVPAFAGMTAEEQGNACTLKAQRPSFPRVPPPQPPSFPRTSGSPHSSFQRKPQSPHSSFRRTPEPSACRAGQSRWVPAFAGMTAEEQRIASALKAQRPSFPRVPQPPPPSSLRTPSSPHASFPRTQSSAHWSFSRTPGSPHSSFRRTPEPSACRAGQSPWGPAFAGMTACRRSSL